MDNFYYNKLREKIMRNINTENNLIHEIDIQKLMTDDFQIFKFKDDKLDINNISDRIVSFFKWKNENLIHEKKDEDFPIEFWMIAYRYHGRDKRNKKILLAPQTFKNINFNIKYIITLFENFSYHYLEKVENEIHEPAIVIMHAKFLSINFYNFNFVRNLLKITQNYYPNLVEIFYILDLPKKYYYFFEFLRRIKSLITGKNDLKLLDGNELSFLFDEKILSHPDNNIVSTRYQFCKSLRKTFLNYEIPEKYMLKFYEINNI